MDRILIRGVNWIGDSVMTLPAIRAVRDFYTRSHITLLVKKWVGAIFERDPNIDRIISYDERFHGIMGKIKGARQLGKYGFQKAILLQNAFDAAILSYLAGIPERIGYERDGRGFLLTKSISFSNELKEVHHTLYYLELLRRAGIEATYRHPWIYMTTEEREEAIKSLAHLKRPIIIVNPGATYGSAKRWPSGYFSELIKMIINQLEATIIIIGSEKEREITNEILHGIDGDLVENNPVIDRTGKTTLRELVRILYAADLLITNDSGPMHIGYALGLPVVAVFGSTSPELTGPLSFVRPERLDMPAEIEFLSRDIVLKKDLPCSPCFKRKCPEGEPTCLQQISPEEVLRAVKKILPQKRAVFFDRDGTLCYDPGYLNRWDDFSVFPEVNDLKKLKERGYLLIGITNQSGISRGLVSRDFVEDVNAVFTDKYGFDAFYYCPHHPDDRCACRKPSPGMLLKARAEFNIDLRRSIVVGDKASDMALAEAVGAEGILISSDRPDRYKHFKSCTGIKEVIEELIR